jgi:hypothetical protein
MHGAADRRLPDGRCSAGPAGVARGRRAPHGGGRPTERKPDVVDDRAILTTPGVTAPFPARSRRALLCHASPCGARRQCAVVKIAAVQKRSPTPFRGSGLRYSRQRPTLPRTYARSTIGGNRLNFRVRNGNGCDPAPMTTGKLNVKDQNEDRDIRPGRPSRRSSVWSSGALNILQR